MWMSKINHESVQPPVYYALVGAWYDLGKRVRQVLARTALPGVPAELPAAAPRFIAGQRRLVHFVRRLQVINLQASLSHLRFAVQRLRFQLQLDRVLSVCHSLARIIARAYRLGTALVNAFSRTRVQVYLPERET